MSKDTFSIFNPSEIANAFNETIQVEYTNDPWIKWHTNLSSWVNQAIYKTMQEIERLEPQKFLDVATGTGDNIILLSETNQNSQFDACDISNSYIEIAKNTITKKKIRNIVFKVSDAHNLLYKEATYDTITCFFSLMYFKNIDQIIQEFIRVSKPKGKIFITTWGGDNKVFKTIMQLLSINEDSTYEDMKNPNQYSDRKKLLHLFSQYDFSSISVKKHETNMQWIGSKNTFWQFFKESNPSIKKMIDSLEAFHRQEKENEILNALSKFENNGILLLPTTMILSILQK